MKIELESVFSKALEVMTIFCILYGNGPGASVYISEARSSEMKAKQNALFERIVSSYKL
jgi:hypothetical protein